MKIIDPTIIIERLEFPNKMAGIYDRQWLKEPIDYYFERSKIWVKDVDQGHTTLHLKEVCDDKNLPKHFLWEWFQD